MGNKWNILPAFSFFSSSYLKGNININTCPVSLDMFYSSNRYIVFMQYTFA